MRIFTEKHYTTEECTAALLSNLQCQSPFSPLGDSGPKTFKKDPQG